MSRWRVGWVALVVGAVGALFLLQIANSGPTDPIAEVMQAEEERDAASETADIIPTVTKRETVLKIPPLHVTPIVRPDREAPQLSSEQVVALVARSSPGRIRTVEHLEWLDGADLPTVDPRMVTADGMGWLLVGGGEFAHGGPPGTGSWTSPRAYFFYSEVAGTVTLWGTFPEGTEFYEGSSLQRVTEP